MTTTHAGNSVQSRPAHWEIINFPVVNTGEIEGKLYQSRGDKLVPQPGILVELHNANDEIVAFKVSGQDGFFTFDHVRYGEYTVTLSEENRDRMTQAAPSADLNQETPNQSVELVVTPPKVVAPALPRPREEPVSITPTPEKPISPPAETPTPGTNAIDISPPPPINMVSAPHILQLGAFSHQGKAVAAITQLRQRYGKPLEGLELRIERTTGAQGPLYHVQAIGNLDAAEAQARCLQIKQLGQNCVVIPPKTKN
jgi:cell division protein FtsN